MRRAAFVPESSLSLALSRHRATHTHTTHKDDRTTRTAMQASALARAPTLPDRAKATDTSTTAPRRARLLRGASVSCSVRSHTRSEGGTHLGGDLDVARVDGLDDIVRRAAVDGAADRLARAEDLLDAVGERRRERLLGVAHRARDVNDAVEERRGVSAACVRRSVSYTHLTLPTIYSV